jgi:hypothetical protein
MARETGLAKSTVRRWLRRDHWSLWMEYWASAEDIWEAAQQDRDRRPDRQIRRLAEEQARKALLVDLDRSLAGLMSEDHLDAMA